MPPKVRTIDQLMKENAAAYDPQRQAAQQRIQQSQQRLAGAEAGIQAAQQNAFGQIEQTASNRNLLFSGFTPDQQARYTAEKTLPALANLRAANEETIQGINEGVLRLDAEQRRQATEMREGDLNKLFQYQQSAADRKFQSQQAKIAYDREMAKLRAEQRFTAQQNAAARAASGGGGQSGPTVNDYAANMAEVLNQRTGIAQGFNNDRYVSPTTWAQLKAQWKGYGLPTAEFERRFSAYKNPSNKNYR